MADVKISELTALTSPDGAEELVVNDAGTTKKITITNATSASLPKAGGTMTGDVTFADNIYAKFGTGNDLRIRHDGSNSYIAEMGTGNLIVQTNGADFLVENTDGDNMINAISDGAVELSHNNAVKLATTSTGVDVTGDVVASGGLYSTVNNSLKIIGGGNASNAGSNLTLYGGTSASAGTFRFRNGTSVLATINATGVDVTGTVTTDGVYLGGTGATNKLDDYETGSWNPTLASSGGTDSGRTYSATPVGTYVKVGKLVTLTFEINCNGAGTLGTGEAVIKGIPFTPHQKGSGTFAKASAFAAAKNAVALSVETNNVRVYLMQSSGESTTVLGYIAPSGWGTPSVWGTMQYTTNE
jgi:hypothetical protein